MFNQPFFDTNQKRIDPWCIPTNLAIDGATVFTIDGLANVKAPDTPKKATTSCATNGSPPSSTTNTTKYCSRLTGKPTVSTVDAAWWLAEPEVGTNTLPGLVFLWAGYNDSSKAALGSAGADDSLAIPCPTTSCARRGPGPCA